MRQLILTAHVFAPCCRYYTQTRAIGAFASVGIEKLAEAGSKGCVECVSSVARWGKRRALSAGEIRKAKTIEMQNTNRPNDHEGDHVSLIHQEQV
jgi:hypothetical protein